MLVGIILILPRWEDLPTMGGTIPWVSSWAVNAAAAFIAAYACLWMPCDQLLQASDVDSSAVMDYKWPGTGGQNKPSSLKLHSSE